MCVVITGVVKNSSYVIGDRRMRKDPRKRAQWNAVLIQSEWRLLDVLWASRVLVRRRVAHWPLVDVHGDTFEDEDILEQPGMELPEINEFFFLTDPDQFVCTHLPDDPNWQLLPQSLRLKSLHFEKFVYVREQFFTMGLEMLADSKRYCMLKTVRGEVMIKFGISEHLGRFAQFRYMLFKELDNGVVSNDSGDSKNWRGCIFFMQSKREIIYVCNMPTVGKYRMDIFGRHVMHDSGLDLVCSYIITCDTTHGRRLPDDPEIGWGPGDELKEAGLSPVSHDGPMIDTDAHVVEIHFRKTIDKDMVFWHSLKHNDFTEAKLLSCATLRVCGNDIIAVLRLPLPGMYAYKLFADKCAKGGDIPNVCNYLIRYKHYEGEPVTAFPSLRWGLLGPSVQARHLGIVSTDESVTIGNIITESPEVDLTFKRFPSDCYIFYEIGKVKQDGAGQDATQVAVNPQDKTRQIRLTLDGSGEYSFNMFVRRGSDDIRIHHVHSVLIGYSGDELPEDEEDTASEASNDDGHPEDHPIVGDESLQAQQNENSFNLQAGFTMIGGLFDFIGKVEEDEQSDGGENATPDPTTSLVTYEEMTTYEDVQRITLPLSAPLVTVERKASQYPADDIRTTYHDNVLTVHLPRDPREGVYVVDVFQQVGDDDNRLEHVHRYDITRLVKVIHNSTTCAFANIFHNHDTTWQLFIKAF